MKSVSGVFNTRDEAVRAIEMLRAAGVDNDHINLLTPDKPDTQFGALPTSDTEAPGMGPALGAVVGGASGTALGLGLTSLLIPGVGVIGVLGLAATALFGAGGVLAGAAAGDKIESTLDDGLPKDEVFIYEDAVHHGKSVIVAFADDDQAATARTQMEAAGAKSIDEARQAWWGTIRDAEAAHYSAVGGDFTSSEPLYRRGYERALDLENRGRSYEEAHKALKACDGDDCDREAYRAGYERGHGFYINRTGAEKGNG